MKPTDYKTSRSTAKESKREGRHVLAEPREGGEARWLDEHEAVDERAGGWMSGSGAEETMHEKVLRLIDKVCAQLTKESAKATVTDLTRLLQLERDLRPQVCERMVVEWVDELRGA